LFYLSKIVIPVTSHEAEEMTALVLVLPSLHWHIVFSSNLAWLDLIALISFLNSFWLEFIALMSVSSISWPPWYYF
jgi:hypothetical protein